jgi:opacity protein-like surface antigen
MDMTRPLRTPLRTLTLASILCALALSPAAAQQRNSYDRGLGLQAGLADLSSGNETVLGANFRFRIAGPPADRDTRGSMRGYLEPEVQYLESDFSVAGLRVSSEDLLVGLNIVGVVPFGAVDTFFGGGPALHFLDTSSALTGLDSSDEKLGLNVHVGVDVHVSEAIALTVAGRLDLIEDAVVDDSQTKVLVGMRFKFR